MALKQCDKWIKTQLSFISYVTPNAIRIFSWKLGLLYYSLVLLILLYICVWNLWLHHGYQSISPIQGAVDAKVKGVTRSIDADANRIFDSTDLVVNEQAGFYIATELKSTVQTQDDCPGAYTTPGNYDERCTVGAHNCTAGARSMSGIQTGECVPLLPVGATPSATEYTCEVRGWCPAENTPGATHKDVFESIDDFTVFIRMNVKFPLFTASDGSPLAWNNVNGTEPVLGWNLFTVKDLLALAEPPLTYEDIQDTGVDLAMLVSFDCNLDHAMDKCQPETFTARRIDTPNSHLSKGYDFRYIGELSGGQGRASNLTRTLVKSTGIRIRVTLIGQGRRFDIIALLTNIASALALVGAATIITDFFALRLSGKSKAYEKVKYHDYVDHGEGVMDLREDELVTNEDSDLQAYSAPMGIKPLLGRSDEDDFEDARDQLSGGSFYSSAEDFDTLKGSP